MRKIMYFVTAGFVAATLSSCDESAKLASQVEGVWSGTTTALNSKHGKKAHKDNPQGVGATINNVTPSITFTPDASVKNGGKVELSSTYSISQPVTSETVDVPFEATANVKSTATGTWYAHDDDEIIISIEPTSISSTIEPESVALGYSVLPDKPVSELDSLKVRILPFIETSFKAEVQKHITSITKLDDVKVKGQTMTLEIGRTDFSFTRQ